jgi:molecular chaperone GrpE
MLYQDVDIKFKFYAFKNKNYTHKNIFYILYDMYKILKKHSDNYGEQNNLLIADFENLQKRTKTEKNNIIKSANKDIIYNLLNIIDDLENATMISNKLNDPKDFNITDSYKLIEKTKNGIHLIYKNLHNILYKHGLKSLNTIGMIFDPNQHDAVSNSHNINIDNDIITKEYQKGYMLNKILLRPAKVIVNINKKP